MSAAAPVRSFDMTPDFWLDVVRHWTVSYNCIPGAVGTQGISDRAFAVDDVFEHLVGLIVPADMGGTRASDAFGRKLAELLIDADAEGHRRSVLRTKDIVLLREILELHEHALVGPASDAK